MSHRQQSLPVRSTNIDVASSDQVRSLFCTMSRRSGEVLDQLLLIVAMTCTVEHNDTLANGYVRRPVQGVAWPQT
jgi:hypothetical protein